MASTCWVSVYSEISCVTQMILVMDWVQYMGTRNMGFRFWKRFQKGMANKAFLHILPNFWHTAIVWRQIPKEYDQKEVKKIKDIFVQIALETLIFCWFWVPENVISNSLICH